MGFLAATILGFVGLIATRRFTRLGRVLLAAAVSLLGLFLLSRLVGASSFPLRPPRPGSSEPGASMLRQSGYGIGGLFPTTADLGVIAAAVFIDRHHWPERWRRVGFVLLGLGVAAQLGVNLAHPAVVLTALTMASAASSIDQLALGARNRRPRSVDVGRTLEGLGYEVATIERFGGFHGSFGFMVGLRGGARLFVKVIGRDSLAEVLPVRLYRAARFRDVGPDNPFRSLRSLVEHEALCALKAHSDGVPTARLEVIAEVPPGEMMMGFNATSLRRLSELDPSERTPELVASVWKVVGALQHSHTVHRRLNADSLLVDAAGELVVVEFSSASLGVVGPELSTDVAEVLAATSAIVGVERAVEFAVAGIGTASVAAALPRLQPLALTAPTRAAVKAAGCLDALRDEVQRVTGSDPVPIAELERIKRGTLLTIGMAALGLTVLIPQFLNAGSLWGELRRASLWWGAAALASSAVTYIGAALATDGSVSQRLPIVPNLELQVATSFVGVAAPGGGLALTARFLQKRGIDTPAAIAAVGVNSVAGVIVHLTLSGLFVALAGSSGLSSFDLPSTATIGAIVAGTLVVAIVGAFIPWSRTVLTKRILPATRRSLLNVAEVARQPGKMLELFGGSLAITMGYIVALAASSAAFDNGPAFTSIALVYLLGSVLSSVAPTPGGIGAVEATLIAGLTAAGMPSTTAAAAVILFRLTTFWLPLLPGWLAFLKLQRSGDI